MSTVSDDIRIVNKLGLHARAAAKVVNLAMEFQSDIRIVNGKRDADAKSIMAVMMLAASRGTDLRLVASGDDAEQAVAAIKALVEGRFGEGE